MDTDYGEEEVVENPTLKAAYNLAPLHQNQPLRWDHKVDLLGEKIYDKVIHLCELCELPILVYGRMLPCKHIFCFDCARKCEKTCKRCAKNVAKVEKSALGTVFVCSHGAPKHNPLGCRRTYLSQRDLQSHIAHRHLEPKPDPKPTPAAAPPQTAQHGPGNPATQARLGSQSGSHGSSSQSHSPALPRASPLAPRGSPMTQPTAAPSILPYPAPSAEQSVYRPLDIAPFSQPQDLAAPHLHPSHAAIPGHRVEPGNKPLPTGAHGGTQHLPRHSGYPQPMETQPAGGYPRHDMPGGHSQQSGRDFQADTDHRRRDYQADYPQQEAGFQRRDFPQEHVLPPRQDFQNDQNFAAQDYDMRIPGGQAGNAPGHGSLPQGSSSQNYTPQQSQPYAPPAVSSAGHMSPLTDVKRLDGGGMEQNVQPRSTNLITIPIQGQDEGQYRPLPYVNPSHGGGSSPYSQANPAMGGAPPQQNFPAPSAQGVYNQGGQMNQPQVNHSQMGQNQMSHNQMGQNQMSQGQQREGAGNPQNFPQGNQEPMRQTNQLRGSGMMQQPMNFANRGGHGGNRPPNQRNPSQGGSPRFPPRGGWSGSRGMPNRMNNPRPRGGGGDGQFRPNYR